MSGPSVCAEDDDDDGDDDCDNHGVIPAISDSIIHGCSSYCKNDDVSIQDI